MPKQLKHRLQQVVKLSEEMVLLADAADAASENVECGILFGTLRDCGYRLRRLAQDELGRRESTFRRDPQLQPANSQSDEPGHACHSPALAESGGRVLIVDDDPDVVTYLQTWFRDRGFATIAAADAAEAWERALAEKPSLVTLDLNMPDQSGVRVYRQLRGCDELSQVPVIVITAVGDPLHCFLGARRSAPNPDGFLSKPIEMHALARLVKKLLSPRPAPAPVGSA